MTDNKDIEKSGRGKTLMLDDAHASWVENLSMRYMQSQVRAAVGINVQQLIFYWTLGHDIVDMHIEERWGQGILKQLSQDLTRRLDRKGFSVTSLGYMRRFYLLYPDAITNLPPVGGEMGSISKLPPAGGEILNPLFCIPWSHHKAILDAAGTNSDKGHKRTYTEHLQRRRTAQRGL